MYYAPKKQKKKVKCIVLKVEHVNNCQYLFAIILYLNRLHILKYNE